MQNDFYFGAQQVGKARSIIRVPVKETKEAHDPTPEQSLPDPESLRGVILWAAKTVKLLTY